VVQVKIVTNLPDVIDSLKEAVQKLDMFNMITDGMREFNEISHEYDKRMKHRAVKFNRGKPRKVSLKRPSPWLSRAELQRIRDEEWEAI